MCSYVGAVGGGYLDAFVGGWGRRWVIIETSQCVDGLICGDVG